MSIDQDQSEYLGVLSNASPEVVKGFVDAIIPELGPIEVLLNRTGLVMLPMEEPVKGSTFYVGEVLVSEARVRVGEFEGYASCLGRDLEQSLAIALIDAALAGDQRRSEIRAFLEQLASTQNAADELLLRQVESTRVEMETF